MELIDRPLFFPEVTIQGRTVGPVVDTGCDHPGGRIYLDRLEAVQIAQLFGFADPDQVRRWQAQLEQLKAENAELWARLHRVGEAVAAEVLAV